MGSINCALFRIFFFWMSTCPLSSFLCLVCKWICAKMKRTNDQVRTNAVWNCIQNKLHPLFPNFGIRRKATQTCFFLELGSAQRLFLSSAPSLSFDWPDLHIHLCRKHLMLGTHQKIIGWILGRFLRWPRELNALQLQKTHANRKSTSKSRKHLHHFDSRWYKCSQHKQIKKHTANAHNTTKYILFAARLFIWVVLWAFAACALSNWWKCFLDLQVFFLFAACFFFRLCCEHLQRVCCQIDESVFLICRWVFFICSLFLFSVVLWAFEACALSNWRKCFLDLQVVFFYLQPVSFFGCVVSIWSVCVVKLMKVFSWFADVFFLFAACFFFWVVLWAFAACAMSNWQKCFLDLQMFFFYL